MSVAPELRVKVLDRDGGFCRYCGQGGLRGIHANQCAIDHIIPRCRGGRDRLENLVVACKSCNLRKGQATPDELGWLVLPPRYPESRHFHDWDLAYTASAKRALTTSKNDAWAAMDIQALPFTNPRAERAYWEGRNAFLTGDSKRRRKRRRTDELRKINDAAPVDDSVPVPTAPPPRSHHP